MADHIFLTGFPGFLGSALAERLLRRLPPSARLYALVQPHFLDLAAARAARLPDAADRLVLLEGDITRPGLGLAAGAVPLADIREVYHLAAVYDLAVSREVGLRVNVEGTRHVLELAARCPELSAFHYVSTCYVSGRFPGIFRESDLDVGQRFNTHYEETKFLAEREVQRRRAAGLPTTIYRPAIVVGDSETGATQKFDGPYYVLRWMLRWRGRVPIPLVGDPDAHVANFVPRDFVVDALDYLSARPESAGQVYHLADPTPLTVAALVDLFARLTDRRPLPIRLPRALVKGALRYVPGLGAWVGIPPEAIDYFAHPTRYACDRALRDLAGSGIACPPFPHYADRLVDFLRAHPEISSAAMV